ncbi:endonuclease/exonuclease/phosphatase family protein [Psychromonas sp. Urea-02u-13]|uniref:endonuclease/exonuclease/phosphatase family protein n=1 Tax=Psychromonas sp. Urea-02u-13 TaxID=2058326 RepID=UPI000C34AA33|nr:endonuclease/exonuclease/phosphatase family protein [Psychromonas sp. Urea-02u-13]PKG38362.1 endonuclease [Psychromonas sp. Urea-02u-13]
MTLEIANSILKIATFNLLNYLEPPFACYEFDRILSAEQWQKKQKWITDYLNESQADVIGFQEVFSPESLKELVKAAGYDYFAVVDECTVVDDFICYSPVVAIASRYPITDVYAVEFDQTLAGEMGLAEDFSFSRKILRATIDLPHIGECDCYVVHFKSKRALFEHAEEAQLSGEENIIESLKANVAGGWGSTIQRGSEATLLMVEMIKRKAETAKPMLLMGDFNNSLSDGVLTQLVTDNLRFVSQIDKNAFLEKYCLQDVWNLFQDSDNFAGQLREPTHYFGETSSVLDHILVSCEFDAKYNKSTFSVSHYETYDRHLINPIFERDGQSTDHGIVLVTLQLRG